MKNFFLRYVCLLVCTLASSVIFATSPVGCEIPACPVNCSGCFTKPDLPIFERTYKHHKDARRTSSKKSTPDFQGVIITHSDFQSHIALGQNRIYQIIPLGNNIPMDVKGIDEQGDTPQTWDMPDFNNYPILNRSVQHVSPESTGFLNDFPGTTHSFYIPNQNAFEMYELTDDDLFLFGTAKIDANNAVELRDLYITASPVPLEWGLEYEGIVTFVYTDDPDVDSTVWSQYYDVIAYGTLNTYDDGPQDAVKLFFTNVEQEYKDGQIIYENSYDEIVWYAKNGHYLRGSLIEGAPKTGQTTFAHMEYQKVTAGMSATQEQFASKVDAYFPNPVSAGELLTVRLGLPVSDGSIEVVNMQGSVVHRFNFSTSGADHSFQTQVPANMPPGVYAYRVYNAKAEKLGFGKVMVQ